MGHVPGVTLGIIDPVDLVQATQTLLDRTATTADIVGNVSQVSQVQDVAARLTS